MLLDRIITDPIISPENATFTSPFSRTPVDYLPSTSGVLPSERDPLAGPPKPKKQFFRARPLWLVPFALTISITRGMTLASRVEVFTELSCSQLHDKYNYPSASEVRTVYIPVRPKLDASPSFLPLYLPSTPPLSHSPGESEGNGNSEGDSRVIRGRTLCVSDPAVQAGAARLQTIITTTMGIFSLLTSSWWSHFGERHGRTRVLAVSTLGLFLTDLIFIIVSTPGNPLVSYSHKLLLLAPVIEGSLGGWSSLTGATTAYISDCTPLGSRAVIFARFTAVVFVGLALGPMIGAGLIRNPLPFLKVEQGVNSVFWVATWSSFINLLFVLFVLPESLSAPRRAINSKGKSRVIGANEIGTSGKDDHAWVITRAVKEFVSPLAEFLPVDVPAVRSSGMLGQPFTRKDWSLTFLALSFFVFNLASGITQLKYLYAEHIYNWGAEQLSYYVSFLGAGRAFNLLIIPPLLLTTLKPAQAVVASTVSAHPNMNGFRAGPKPTKSHFFSEIRFGLLVMRCSMIVEFLSHALVVLSPLPGDGTASAWWSQFVFTGVTSLTCAGAGVMPVVQSLALSTLQGRKMAEKEGVADGAEIIVGPDAAHEPGKLFGALSTLQVVGQTIIGPILFGMIYSSTVASFPKVIFAVAAAIVMVAIVLAAFVRPDISLSMLKNTRRKRKSPAAPRHVAEERRGRSRAKKDLRGGSASVSYGATRNDASVSNWRQEAGPSGRA